MIITTPKCALPGFADMANKGAEKMKRFFSISVLFSGLFGVVLLLFSTHVWASGPVGPVPKTGRTTITGAGDDGDFQKGVPWPNPRFTDNGDGTVKDKLTGLTWMKNANCWGSMNWSSALARITSLNAVVNPATCAGYTGLHRDWRLPSIRELTSLEDLSRTNPILPLGHPFSGVQAHGYWSGTSSADITSYAWVVNLGSGAVNGYYYENVNGYVWPVRGGQ